ncbi:MAG: 2-oxoacid:ferredoxin oxidoreductase subunit gamma [Thermodesulfobacteria bacterium]|nr:2-oxoacid:ferredoxin oxidoreductase subunit gamma [Thermodesulfobacteriota bacterium]
MRIDLIVSGFGGQGVLFAGNLIAYSAMLQGFEVTYLPVYGPEMRGGTCNCTVIISDKQIASPLVKSPNFLIIMNYPSFLKFVPRLKKGGKVIVNSDLVKPEDVKDQIPKGKGNFYFVPVNSLAESLGTPGLANLCAVGAFYKITGLFTKEILEKALKEVLSKGKMQFFEPNMKAFEAGAKYIDEVRNSKGKRSKS